MTTLADQDDIAAAIREAVDSIELAGSGPDLALVHAGARRRARRRIAAATAGAVAFTAAGTLAVAAVWPAALQAVVPAVFPDEPASVPVTSLAPHERPVVDAATGVLLLPIERYGASQAEEHEILWAGDLLLKDCVADRGLVWKPVDLRSQNDIPRRYGNWTMDQATTLGYGVPPTSEAETGALANPPSEEVDDAALSCARSLETDPSSVRGELAIPQLGAAAAANWASYDAALASAEGRAAVGDWEACLESAGIQPPRDGWTPPAAETADRQAELQIAMQDVTCKEQTDLVQRLADLEASYQAVYIRAHEAELTEVRRQTDETVALAARVIAEHSD